MYTKYNLNNYDCRYRVEFIEIKKEFNCDENKEMFLITNADNTIKFFKNINEVKVGSGFYIGQVELNFVVLLKRISEAEFNLY
jgi:hypothetical protein